MILVGIGSNLASSYGTSRQTCEAALRSLQTQGIQVGSVSRWYRSAPVPLSDAPWYVNAVACVETDLSPQKLLQQLQMIEAAFERERPFPNAPRTLDLDLLAFHDIVLEEENLILPHPRLAERAFVLLPLADIAPSWRHPVTGEPLDSLIARLPEEQKIEEDTANSKGDGRIA